MVNTITYPDAVRPRPVEPEKGYGSVLPQPSVEDVPDRFLSTYDYSFGRRQRKLKTERMKRNLRGAGGWGSLRPDRGLKV
jgi:hypothetical protein